MEEQKTERFEFKITPSQLADLKAKSEITGVPIAEIVRRFIDQGLKQKARK